MLIRDIMLIFKLNFFNYRSLIFIVINFYLPVCSGSSFSRQSQSITDNIFSRLSKKNTMEKIRAYQVEACRRQDEEDLEQDYDEDLRSTSEQSRMAPKTVSKPSRKNLTHRSRHLKLEDSIEDIEQLYDDTFNIDNSRDSEEKNYFNETEKEDIKSFNELRRIDRRENREEINSESSRHRNINKKKNANCYGNIVLIAIAIPLIYANSEKFLEIIVRQIAQGIF